MLDPILQKLDFSGPNLGKQALVLCIVLYCLVLACTFSSIYSQGFSNRKKLFWAGIVLLIPFGGILLYLGLCIYMKLRTHPSFERFTRAKRKSPAS